MIYKFIETLISHMSLHHMPIYIIMSNLSTDLIAAGEVTAIAEGQPIMPMMPMYPGYPGYVYYSPMSGKMVMIILGMFIFIIILAMLFGNSNMSSSSSTSNMVGGMPDIPCNCNKNH